MNEENRLIADAQSKWGNGLIEISNRYECAGLEAAKAVAEKLVNELYFFDGSPVLFKPTLASGEHTFRSTKDGAISYFIGNSLDFPLDRGFGLLGWRSFETHEAATIVEDSIFLWMGSVVLTDKTGDVTKVDKSWGYKRDSTGNLRIVLHHSSLPFTP